MKTITRGVKIAFQGLAHSFCRLVRSSGINIEIRDMQHCFLRVILPLVKELVKVADKGLGPSMPCNQSSKIMLHVVLPLPTCSFVEVRVFINTERVEFRGIKRVQ